MSSLKQGFGERADEGQKISNLVLPSHIFEDCAIPDGAEGFPTGQIVSYSEEDRADLARLADDLICAVVAGKGLTIFFDNDGTLFRFKKDPKDVAIDPDCYQALLRLSWLPWVRAISLTGREVLEARDLMLTPGLEVRNSHGESLTQGGVKRQYFSIVGSHGVQCLAPDKADGSPGDLDLYVFSPEEKAFVNRFQDLGRAFRRTYPDLTVEIKHGSVGINTTTLQRSSEEREAIYRDLLTAIEAIVNDPDAPTYEGQKIFNIRKEGDNEFEVRPTVYGKDFGIRTFGGDLGGRKMVFLCDSLGEHGTDMPAAALVNAFGGDVLMVRNGRNVPLPADSPACPRAIFANPTMLGRFLGFVATKVEEALGSKPKPSSVQGLGL